MSIRTKEYCDICEEVLGEGHEDALIIKNDKPAFAQLIWTYYKKGLQIFKKNDGEPVLKSIWLGQPNRLEFCEKHGADFNTLLKFFCKRDPQIFDLLDNIKGEVAHDWSKKQREIDKEFKAIQKIWLGSKVSKRAKGKS